MQISDQRRTGDASASPGMRAGWRTAPQTAPAVVALERNLFTTH